MKEKLIVNGLVIASPFYRLALCGGMLMLYYVGSGAVVVAAGVCGWIGRRAE